LGFYSVATMNLELDHIFSSKRLGSFEKEYKALIYEGR
jgi:hypothetical protein